MSELHHDLSRSKSIDTEIASGVLIPLKDITLETFEAAKALNGFLDRRQALQKKLAESADPSTQTITKHLRDVRPDDVLLASLLQACSEVKDLEACRKELLAKAIALLSDCETNEDFIEAVSRQRSGKSAFQLPFGKGEARKLIAAVKILGSAPANASEWDHVHDALAWRNDARKTVAKWNSVVTEFGVPSQLAALDGACRAMTQSQELIADIHALVFDYDAKLHNEAEKVFGTRVADSFWSDGEAAVHVLKESLHGHVDKGRLAYAMNRLGELKAKLDGRSGGIVDNLRAFLTDVLGKDMRDDGKLQNAWLAMQAELARVNGLRPFLEEIERVAALIVTGGAKQWAARIRNEAAEADNDPVTPSSWREAWNWRRAVIFLEKSTAIISCANYSPNARC